MTGDDEARLRMAYEALRLTAPSDAEVQAGARRAAAAVYRSGDRPRLRRVVATGVGATLLGAAVVYAAAGGFSRVSGPSGVDARRPRAAVQAPRSGGPGIAPSMGPAAVAAQVPSVGDGSERAALRTLPNPPPARPRQRRVAPTAAARTSQASAEQASWRRVDEALARGDNALAATALERLGEQANDDDTRAKSQLGLAQLALARGDCERARHHARQVLSLGDAAVQHYRRARDVMARCTPEK